jgi:hypothetical protein
LYNKYILIKNINKKSFCITKVEKGLIPSSTDKTKVSHFPMTLSIKGMVWLTWVLANGALQCCTQDRQCCLSQCPLGYSCIPNTCNYLTILLSLQASSKHESMPSGERRDHPVPPLHGFLILPKKTVIQHHRALQIDSISGTHTV